jgi:hypothetical protein
LHQLVILLEVSKASTSIEPEGDVELECQNGNLEKDWEVGELCLVFDTAHKVAENLPEWRKQELGQSSREVDDLKGREDKMDKEHNYTLE